LLSGGRTIKRRRLEKALAIPLQPVQKSNLVQIRRRDQGAAAIIMRTSTSLFRDGWSPDEHSFMAFDTGVAHLAREFALSNPGQP
jgi:hypothetical protein